MTWSLVSNSRRGAYLLDFPDALWIKEAFRLIKKQEK